MLRVEGVHRAFGGVTALAGVDLEIRPGAITGLIGPNGAGKTTLFDCVTGFQSVDAGQIWFNGKRIDGQPAYRIARMGMARTFQLVRLLPAMDALENLMVAHPGHPGAALGGAVFGGWQRDEERIRGDALAWLRFVGMEERADVLGQQLSYGQSKLVEIARMLSLEPTLMLMDEPMAGINPTLRNKVLDLFAQLRDQGKTLLIIEHDIEMIMEHCDVVVVMDRGRVIAQGPPDQVRDDPAVVRAYLGVGRQT